MAASVSACLARCCLVLLFVAVCHSVLLLVTVSLFIFIFPITLHIHYMYMYSYNYILYALTLSHCWLIAVVFQCT